MILTTFERDDYVFEALRAGASGFLLKNAPPEELVHAVRVVAAGDALLAPSVTRRVIEEYARRPAPRAATTPSLERLTEREVEVLRLLATGKSNAELAAHLYLGEGTIKTHVSHVLAQARAARPRAGGRLRLRERPRRAGPGVRLGGANGMNWVPWSSSSARASWSCSLALGLSVNERRAAARAPLNAEPHDRAAKAHDAVWGAARDPKECLHPDVVEDWNQTLANWNDRFSNRPVPVILDQGGVCRRCGSRVIRHGSPYAWSDWMLDATATAGAGESLEKARVGSWQARFPMEEHGLRVARDDRWAE